MEKNFKVVIYTPYGKYLESEADYLSVKSTMGVLGILPNHAPLITTLEISRLTIKNNSVELKYAISGGVLNIKKEHTVTILTNAIERSDEIDVSRALAAKQRAEARLNAKIDIDVARAKISLLKALNRLEVSDKN